MMFWCIVLHFVSISQALNQEEKRELYYKAPFHGELWGIPSGKEEMRHKKTGLHFPCNITIMGYPQ